MTRRVAYGTGVRVVTMATTAVVLYEYFRLPGALVGAASLSSGVVFESVATRFMALSIPDRIRALEPSREVLTYRQIAEFYLPLALTSVISLAVHPMVTFSLGQSRLALESLAVYPVVTALTFIFRSMALSYQEVAITLLDGTRENFRLIARFAFVLGVAATAGLVVIAFHAARRGVVPNRFGTLERARRTVSAPIAIVQFNPVLLCAPSVSTFHPGLRPRYASGHRRDPHRGHRHRGVLVPQYPRAELGGCCGRRFWLFSAVDYWETPP